MKPRNSVIILSVSLLSLLACVLCAVFIFSRPSAQKVDRLSYCKSLSSDVGEDMLVGTWIAEPGTGTDQITLRADHTYSQVYSNPVTNISFQQDQNFWKAETISGITYLHLDRMRKCDSYESTCAIEVGGGGDKSWINFCTGKVVQMKNSVTLIVLKVVPGDIYYSLSDLKLCHFLSDPDASAVCFRRLSR